MKFKAFLLLLIGLNLIFVTKGNDDFDDSDDGVTIEEEVEEGTIKVDDNKIQYKSPTIDSSKIHFGEHFDNIKEFNKKWIKSEAKKDDIAEEIAKYDGLWKIEQPERNILDNDLGLVLKSKAKHAAISSKFNRPFKFTNKPLIVQYEVTLQDGQECGGSYIKLLTSSKDISDLTQFRDKTPYTIMFGPDKCGNDVKLHFIFRHVNPRNGSIEEKHAKKSKDRLEEPFKDKQPHLYKLVINPDNTYQISVDHKVFNEGSLLKDFTPPVNPPAEIDDPSDFKPESWDEREKIPDPTAIKPDDWDVPAEIVDPNAEKPEGWIDDEQEMIPDTNAEKPMDWDEEIDGQYESPMIQNPLCEKVGCGEWKPPMIPNPEYKGKWRAPLLDNPNYQGKWSPRRIPNPDFYEDNDPFSRMTTIEAVGIELWSMSENILFDNIVITDDGIIAQEWAELTYDLKRKQLDQQAETFVQKMKNITNENPWIVALVVVIVGLPVSIILYMLCSSSKEQEHTKKTDNITQDDIPPEGNTGTMNKEDLNASNLDADNDTGPIADVSEDDNDNDEQPEQIESEEIEPVAAKATENNSTARKRKPRKD